MPSRRTFLAAASALAAARASWAQGNVYPDHPIKLVVPNLPGGPSDIVGRMLADGMRASLGQPIVIDNRPGAAGLIGTAAVTSAPADGYTVLVTSRSNHVIAPLVQKSTKVEPGRDLAPVGLALRAVGMLAAPAKAPYKTLKQLVAYAKANPSKVFYGSAGIGAANHISMEQFRQLAGIEMTHVPFRGSGGLITGLMGGEVGLALLDFSSAQPGLQSGAIVPLVQTASKRLASLPNVPTLIESDFRKFDPSFWIGLAVPKGTPGSVIAALNRALNAALADTQLRARAQVNGWELVGGAPKALADTVAQDLAEYPEIVRRLDIKAS
ncbi:MULTISPECIES: Bug family tripartite tricarboxylate transporter substrate binding protein [Ramlibacter]|uniref:Tripartite tricarboxylate transporter substrate binding protein n=1 Tax=Ramlibacter pinisoli TaxID=2682844 RepID=A0A6N8IPQ6_9BURK|nr:MULTISPECIES: tripartite tricarboxylate transporter substrate binding protein [Ramlibacter]MBA2960481.1 tripartite tricarboxylate transporter substrate binding protein [Ramlibacter sp. CGMCC 1.13660]MVQ27813.1 tripartite tricarboxylate transporter substrate binding protein [Ramlibacter pinisoli]